MPAVIQNDSPLIFHAVFLPGVLPRPLSFSRAGGGGRGGRGREGLKSTASFTSVNCLVGESPTLERESGFPVFR